MKKIISFALVLVMLASMLVITVNAADPFGTIVEAKYAEQAPDMSARTYPDASWGEPAVHIDANSPNTAITDYMKGRGETSIETDRTLSFDAYMRWTDSALYLCFVSPDSFIRGAADATRGDGFQIDIIYGTMDMSHYSAEICSSANEFKYAYSYILTFAIDDDTCIEEGAAAFLEKTDLYYSEKNNEIIAKLEIPFSQLGMSKNEKAKDGDIFSFSMIRIDGNKDDSSGYTGWLEWGNFFDQEKGCQGDSSIYVPASMNPKTTTGNSIKLVGKSSGATTETPVTPVTTGDKVTLKGTPSSWAKAEVEAALAEGLIPEELTDGFTNGISRANLSKILSKLLDKVYGKAPEKSDAKFTDTTDADVLKAANLGIINGYEQADGTFMFKPDNTLKRSEMAAIINRVAKLCGQTVTGFDGEVTFTDTASHWCKGELGWPVHNGIVKGTSDTTFSPENTLTVEQTIMMIYRTYTALK